MDLRQQLNQLDQMLRTLQIDYERFLSGALVTPPEDREQEVAHALRDLRVQTRSPADGFRLSALEARFNSYRELFKKRLRESEIGLRPKRPAEIAAARRDPHEGVTVSRRVDGDWAAALFQGLYGGGNTPAIDLDTFHGYLERQVATLRERTGCTSVRLRIVEADGKMKLRAKPLKSGPGSPSA
jgi:hypothetical protein